MIFYYGRAGIYADVALVKYCINIWIFIWQSCINFAWHSWYCFDNYMSVDANVLIFERVREDYIEIKV